MIQVNTELKFIFVKGAHRYQAIEDAVLKATGKKRWNRKEWTIVGLADETSQMIISGMPFTPPDDRPTIGYLRDQNGRKR